MKRLLCNFALLLHFSNDAVHCHVMTLLLHGNFTCVLCKVLDLVSYSLMMSVSSVIALYKNAL